jgi:DNA-binding MarR family transcriptional regulator
MKRSPESAAAPLEMLGPQLILAARLLDELGQAQVNHEAGERIARPALMRLVPFLDAHGIRPTELAKRADVSKQSVGQTLRACEALGVVQFTPDPADGRAYLVRLTPYGESTVRYGQSVLAFLIAELTARFGDDTMTDLATALAAVIPVLAEWSAHGAPTRSVASRDVPFKRRARRAR